MTEAPDLERLIPWLMSKPDQAEPGLDFTRIVRRPDWQRQAACRGSARHAWTFFPTAERCVGQIARAKAVCSTCPVARECLDFALSAPEPLDGIWGGTTAAERRRMLEPSVA